MQLDTETKNKCVNSIILAGVISFAILTIYLIFLLIHNGLMLVQGIDNQELVITTIFLGSWIIFAIAIMTKAIHIYVKLPKTKLW